LDANNLPQRVHDLNQVALRLHHLVDRLVRHRRLVDHVLVLATFDPRRRGDMVSDREAAPRLVARHRTPRAVAAAVEAVVVPEAAHDVRARSHAARNDAEITATRPYRALAGQKHVLAEVALTGHVVVVAVDRLE